MLQSLKTGLWLTPERLRVYPILLFAMLGCALGLLIATTHDGQDRFGRPLGPDFSEIWVAGQEALAGRPQDTYDIAAHKAKQEELFGRASGFYLWSYPPYFLAIAAFLACFPYITALLFWQAGTLSFYLVAIFAILRRAGLSKTQSLVPVLAFPAVFVNLVHGQNGFLTAALVTGGLLNLIARPILAGALFACLAYKPQFAVMIPFALLAGGYWRCILSGIAALGLLTLGTVVFFGPNVWLYFPEGIKIAKSLVLEHGGAGYEKMQSLFAMARLLGSTIDEAYLLQGLTVAGLVMSLVWMWHSYADLRLKGAALLTAALIATPYSYDYDLVLLGPALAFAISYSREHGFSPYEKTLFACVWIVPLIARPFAMAAHIPTGAILTILFFTLLIRRARQDSSTPSRVGLGFDPMILEAGKPELGYPKS